ncbi:MAG: hypothetical protein ABIQ06_04355 [Caldimonas sp.]
MRSPDEIRRLSELLDHAMDLDASQHEAWLASLEGDRRALVPQLREALGQLGRAGGTDLLGRGIRLEGFDPSEPAAGDVVGPYRLQRCSVAAAWATWTARDRRSPSSTQPLPRTSAPRTSSSRRQSRS